MEGRYGVWWGDTECLKQCLATLVRIKYIKPLFPEIPRFSNWNRGLKQIMNFGFLKESLESHIGVIPSMVDY